MEIFKKKRNKKEGLYDPVNEHDSCGLGFIANIKGKKSHDKREVSKKRSWEREKKNYK